MAEQRAVLIQAAIAAGYRAFRAGEDIERALTIGGYAVNIAQSVANYFSQDPTNASREGASLNMKRSGTTSSTPQKRARGGTAPVAKPVKKYVGKCMKQLLEKKYTDTAITGTMTLAGTTIGCNLLATGTSSTTRTGNTTQGVEVIVRGTHYDANPSVSRYILFWDRQPNGALPAVTDVLQSASVVSNYNCNNVVGVGGARFSILKDMTITTNIDITATAHQQCFNFKLPLTSKTFYSGTTSAISSIAKNSLVWLEIGNTTSATHTVNVQYRFTDA